MLKDFKKDFVDPIVRIKFALILIIGFTYYFNSRVCALFYEPDTEKWWDLYFIFQSLMYCLTMQVACLTDKSVVKLVSNIVLAMFLEDLITQILPHEKVHIETTTVRDYIAIILSIIISIFNYYSTKTIYDYFTKCQQKK